MIIGAAVINFIKAGVDGNLVYFVISMLIFVYCEVCVVIFLIGKKAFLRNHDSIFPEVVGIVYAIAGMGGFLFLILAIAIYLFKLR